jgi:hypothetical protein
MGTERPIVFLRANVNAVHRQPVTQKADAGLFHQRKILSPHVVVTTFFELIDPHPPVIDRRRRILDARSKQK